MIFAFGLVVVLGGWIGPKVGPLLGLKGVALPPALLRITTSPGTRLLVRMPYHYCREPDWLQSAATAAA
jgi:hypothetical protein